MCKILSLDVLDQPWHVATFTKKYWEVYLLECSGAHYYVGQTTFWTPFISGRSATETLIFCLGSNVNAC